MPWRWWRTHDITTARRRLRARHGIALDPGNNGRRGNAIQTPRRRPRSWRRRLVVGVAAAALVVSGLAARHCRVLQTITEDQRKRARADIIAGCRINGCTADELAALLAQLDAMPTREVDR